MKRSAVFWILLCGCFGCSDDVVTRPDASLRDARVADVGTSDAPMGDGDVDDARTEDAALEPPIPLRGMSCGHAHNDYLHPVPLIEALDRGFCSVEADIFLRGGELLVAHEEASIDPARTLVALYLDPLRQRVMTTGRAYMGDEPLILLIDVKDDAEGTYAALHLVLEQYSDIFTSIAGDRVDERAVTAIISGARDRATMESQALRYAAMDGRLDDLGTGAPLTLIPLVSASALSTFLWVTPEPLSADKRVELRGYADAAHAEGRLIRFWAVPDAPAGWGEMQMAGVDLLNADDLAGLETFLSP